jgi:hypothetical protein
VRFDGCGVQRRAVVELDVVAQREREFAGVVFDGPPGGERRIELLVTVHRNQRIQDVVENFGRGGAGDGGRIDVVDLVPNAPGERATTFRSACRRLTGSGCGR